LPLGHEYLVLIGMTASAGSPPPICHLEQPGIEAATLPQTKGGVPADAAALLDLLQPPHGTRAAVTRFPESQSQAGLLVRTYVLDVEN
jgi:hypothetical protein